MCFPEKQQLTKRVCNVHVKRRVLEVVPSDVCRRVYYLDQETRLYWEGRIAEVKMRRGAKNQYKCIFQSKDGEYKIGVNVKDEIIMWDEQEFVCAKSFGKYKVDDRVIIKKSGNSDKKKEL
eukprot:UN23177